MNIATFDIEANSLDTATAQVHCVVIHDGTTHKAFTRAELDDAVHLLNGLLATGWVLAGHNIIEYDLPILQRHGLAVPGKEQVYDSLVVSRAAKPGNLLFQEDQAFLRRRPDLKDELKAGAHSLKAWGLRLGNLKDDYDGGWEEFSQEMLDYCVQDVALNVDLIGLLRQRIPDTAALIECEVARICRDMRLRGVGFDVEKAEHLTIQLAARRFELTGILKAAFPARVVKTKQFTPKRTQKRKHTRFVNGELVECDQMVQGETFWKGEVEEFNPASTEHIASRLMEKYNWRPTKYTPGGKPQVTAEVLADLRYPEAPLLAEYQEIKKVLGYIAEGNNAWLRLEKNGRLHGKVNPTGTVTSRASHNSPNTGNVPSRTELGHKCRSLFRATSGRVIVGADASGLQLRGLGHYLSPWDGGAFARQCEDGDIHEYMRAATGLYYRSRQKNWTYARIFGAGDTKLGAMRLLDWHDAYAEGLTTEKPPKQGAAKRLGRETLENLGDAIPAFNELQKRLKEAARRGFLTALDGRKLPVASEHLALAVLLQSFEACIMKLAMVIANDWLREIPGAGYVLWVHDEFQVECPEKHADAVGKILVRAMNRAGERLGCQVRIDGEYQVGQTWADTH
jgi:hypothetical protein